jgi:hypothetical protein
MLNWEDRPFEIAYSLNPAFLAVLLYEAIQSFQKEKTEGMPYPLIFLIVPLVFYIPIRESLPKDANKSLHNWLKEYPQTAIHLHKAISQIVPYTKEAIIFAMQHQMIEITKEGNFKVFKAETDILKWDENSRTYQMQEKSKYLGKWFVKSGSTEVIYRTLGITP